MPQKERYLTADLHVMPSGERSFKVAKTLNPSEAVYGFAAWLTTRSESITIGSVHDAAPVTDLVNTFCKINNLPKVSSDWPNNLIHPSGEVAVPNIGHNTVIDKTA